MRKHRIARFHRNGNPAHVQADLSAYFERRRHAPGEEALDARD